jgi:hypothetical protein
MGLLITKTDTKAACIKFLFQGLTPLPSCDPAALLTPLPSGQITSD